MALDGVISVLAGVIGFSILFGFINGINTTGMDTTQLLVLGAIPTFFLLMILYGIFRMIKSSRSSGL